MEPSGEERTGLGLGEGGFGYLQSRLFCGGGWGRGDVLAGGGAGVVPARNSRPGGATSVPFRVENIFDKMPVFPPFPLDTDSGLLLH